MRQTRNECVRQTRLKQVQTLTAISLNLKTFGRLYSDFSALSSALSSALPQLIPDHNTDYTLSILADTK